MDKSITIEQLEKLRLKAKKLDTLSLVLAVISLPIYIWLFYMAEQGEEALTALFILKLITVSFVVSLGTFALLWCLIARKANKRFKDSYKSKYVVETISSISGFNDLKYYPKDGFSWDDIRNAAVVGCGDKKYFESEDLLFGIYDNVRFKISDVTSKKYVPRGKKSRTEIIFDGQVMCFFQFDEMKKSNGHIQIFQKELLSDISGWKAEHEIHTENEDFNSRFNVYTSDEHNAYYILTPQRIEKIMEFEKTINEQISISFYDDKMFVAVKRWSMFDPTTDKPVLEQVKSIADDVEYILKAKEILVD